MIFLMGLSHAERCYTCCLMLFWIRKTKEYDHELGRGIITYSLLHISLCEASGKLLSPLVTWLCDQQIKTVRTHPFCHAMLNRSDSLWARIPDCSFAHVRAPNMPERKAACREGQCGFVIRALFSIVCKQESTILFPACTDKSLIHCDLWILTYSSSHGCHIQNKTVSSTV